MKIVIGLVLVSAFAWNAHAGSTPSVQLSRRIEIRPSGEAGPVQIEKCSFLACSSLGKSEGYSRVELKKALSKVSASRTVERAILAHAIKGERSGTFAHLSSPFEIKSKKENSIVGYGGSGFLGVLTYAEGNKLTSEKDFEYQMVPEMIDNFEYFETKPSIDEVAAKLTRALDP